MANDKVRSEHGHFHYFADEFSERLCKSWPSENDMSVLNNKLSYYILNTYHADQAKGGHRNMQE
jgi:hypothetical protein